MAGIEIAGGVTFGGGVTITPPSVATDPYFANVSLLLTGQGTAGSTAIVDSSPNAWAVTNGSNRVTYSATSPQIGTTSMRFPGTGNYLRIPQVGVANVGTGNFTIEAWMKFDSVSTTQTLLWFNGVLDGNGYAGIRVDISTTYGPVFRHYLSSTAGSWRTTSLVTTTSMSTNTWYYWTMVRNGATITVYVNGVAEATYNIAANSIYSNVAENWIGAKNFGTAGSPSVNQPMAGYIEQLRFTTGVARYTTNFTPPVDLMPTS